MTDFILKTCLQLILTWIDTMNEQEKSRLIRNLAGAIRFCLVCVGLATLVAALHWIRWW